MMCYIYRNMNYDRIVDVACNSLEDIGFLASRIQQRFVCDCTLDEIFNDTDFYSELLEKTEEFHRTAVIDPTVQNTLKEYLLIVFRKCFPRDKYDEKYLLQCMFEHEPQWCANRFYNVSGYNLEATFTRMYNDYIDMLAPFDIEEVQLKILNKLGFKCEEL